MWTGRSLVKTASKTEVFSPKTRDADRKPRGFTFCQYRRKEDAADAVKGMNGRDLGGKKISVEFCRIPRPEVRERDRDRDRDRFDRRSDRRRSHSPSRGRFRSRSRSRDRGRDKERERDRDDFWSGGKDDYFRDFPSHFDQYGHPPRSSLPSEYSRPPSGSPHPAHGPRLRSGLLEPPYPLPPSNDGPGRGPPPPGPPRGGSGYGGPPHPEDVPHMRESGYRSVPPPPGRGGFSSGRGGLQPPPSGPSQYGPPQSGGRDYYDDPYYTDPSPASRPMGNEGGGAPAYGPPPDSSNYRARPSEMPPSVQDYPPPKRSDVYDSYSSAPPSQPRDNYSSYNNGTGSGGYRPGGPPGPASSVRPTSRFSSATDTGYTGGQPSYDYKAPGPTDSYYAPGLNRGPPSYSSDVSGRPPASKPPVDRYGGPPRGASGGDVGSRPGYSNTPGTGPSVGGSNVYSGAPSRGYDSGSYTAQRGPVVGDPTPYGGSGTQASSGVGRGGTRSVGYQSATPQGGGSYTAPQVPSKVGYTAYGAQAQARAAPGVGQNYGQEYKPAAMY